jgi:NADH-quinone oxidoreductase subunit M
LQRIEGINRRVCLLSLAIWVPILAGVLVLPRAPTATRRWRAEIGAGGACWAFASRCRCSGFDTAPPAMQFVEEFGRRGCRRFNINYHLGVDGISMPFILLNSFTTVLVVLAGWQVIQDKVGQYMAAFLIMSGLINGVFAALDGVLFYVFFEAMLIPLYLIIGMWGGPNRVYAAIKFFLYTLLGSLLMLVSLIYLYHPERRQLSRF